jgi:hypothetical protein
MKAPLHRMSVHHEVTQEVRLILVAVTHTRRHLHLSYTAGKKPLLRRSYFYQHIKYGCFITQAACIHQGIPWQLQCSVNKSNTLYISFTVGVLPV